MISNLKISEGDLVMIHIEGANVTSRHLDMVRDRLMKWAKKRGLNDIEVVVSTGEHKVSVNKFSVNDIFEEQVLKGDDNG